MNANDVTNSILGKKEGFQKIYADTEKIQNQTGKIKQARHEIENIVNNFEV